MGGGVAFSEYGIVVCEIMGEEEEEEENEEKKNAFFFFFFFFLKNLAFGRREGGFFGLRFGKIIFFPSHKYHHGKKGGKRTKEKHCTTE